MNKTNSLISILLFASIQLWAGTDYHITVNKLNTAPINHQTILSIIKAEKLTWETGVPIFLLINDLSKTPSDLFSNIMTMSKNQFIELWRIKFFSGRALLPKQVKTSKEIIDSIEENPSGIYISVDSVPNQEIMENPSLKTIKLSADF